MIADQRGAAAIETVITFPILLLCFLGSYLLSYLFAADIVVERSASAAARAAAVYMADSKFYFPNRATREAYITAAARRVTVASPALDPSSVAVTITSKQESPAVTMLTTDVKIVFDCSPFIVSFLCGLDRRVDLSASASMPRQSR